MSHEHVAVVRTMNLVLQVQKWMDGWEDFSFYLLCRNALCVSFPYYRKSIVQHFPSYFIYFLYTILSAYSAPLFSPIYVLRWTADQCEGMPGSWMNCTQDIQLKRLQQIFVITVCLSAQQHTHWLMNEMPSSNSSIIQIEMKIFPRESHKFL